jgi:S1-C subfamily serine protease
MILNFRHLSRFTTALGILLAVVAFGLRAQEIPSLDLERVERATVFIMQARNVGDNLIISCVGTGTIVSRDGLILTNAHNTVPGENCPGETLVIALNVRLSEPPVPRFRAEIVQADPGLDLALLRITRESDGRLIEPGTLTLPFVELADSSAVQLDDTITVVGFPNIGDDPITVERGTITGFMAEPSGGDQSWLKTSATIRGTMSGGGAYNQQGQLVGVPTTAPLSSESPEATCLIVQDTNGDDLVNSNDSCIPVGGFINSLRPSSFALPLLRAAALGLSVEMVTPVSEPAEASGEPSLRYLGCSPSVNEAGMPTSMIRSLPTGSNSLYLFFDYENMTPETVYELRVFTNGILNPNFSLSPVRWSGGRRGIWYVGGSGQPWPNGIYDFTLLVNGVAAGNARLLVGEVTQGTPQFSDIVFGLRDLQGNILGNSFVLPTGSVAFARFLYRSMTPDTPWAAIWYYQGEEVFRTEPEAVWLADDGADGTKDISIESATGLLPGSYRLELYIENRLAAVSDFYLAGAQEGAFARIFTDPHFTTASTPEEARNAARISSFSGGTQSIYALFDWEQIAEGTLWGIEWTVDGEPFYQRTMPWTGSGTGENFLMRLTSPTGVPDGTYAMTLYVGEIPFNSTEARVGIGQLPIDRFVQASGVQLRGQILDSETLEGIAGVSVLLVSEDFSVADFTRDWRQDQLYDLATTDRNGRFQIERPLQRDVPYSIVIIAEGYLPLTADAVEITDETRPDNSPIDVTLHLTRG